MVRTGHALGPEWLGSAAGWLARVAPAWEAMTGEVPQQRAYRLLVSSLHLEAWLICWPPGGRLALHDHGGASGAVEVVRGSLDETFLDSDRRAQVRQLLPDRALAFDGDYIHDVINNGETAATSVHIYGAANRSMHFYRLHPSRREPLMMGPVTPAFSLDETLAGVTEPP